MSEALEKILKKKYGDIFLSADQITQKEKVVIPVSPKLDIGLNGGVPEGSWFIISGKPKLGKSTLALQFCATAQKEEYGARRCYYLDAEGRLEKKILNGIEGLQQDKLTVVKSSQGNILSSEKFLTIAEQIIKTEPNIILVIDSASAMCSQSEMDSEEIKGTGRNNGPKLLAEFTRRLANVVPVQNNIVIIIQHMIANTSGYGPSFMEDGGNKICYQSDIKLRGRTFTKWEDNTKKQIGQIATWDVVHSALGAPGATVEGYIRFGYGIDSIWELIDIATDLDLIEKGGAWFTIKFTGEEIKLQGQNKVWQYLNDNPELCKKLKEEIRRLCYNG
jgi:recombination protein RecA